MWRAGRRDVRLTRLPMRRLLTVILLQQQLMAIPLHPLTLLRPVMPLHPVTPLRPVTHRVIRPTLER